MKQASVFAAALLAALSAQPAAAQPRAGTTQQTPRSAAPIDLTGYWVAVVTVGSVDPSRSAPLETFCVSDTLYGAELTLGALTLAAPAALLN